MISAITLVGSGNVAWHFGNALFQKGIRINAVVARNQVAGEQLAKSCSTVWHNKLEDVASVGDMVLVAVKDDAYEILDFPESFKDVLVAHTSGSKPFTALPHSLKNRAVFYPLQTFSKAKPMSFAGVPLIIETEQQSNTSALQQLAEALGAQPYQLTHPQRLKVHLAAVFVNNFCNHLMQVGQNMLEEADIPIEILKQLALETATKAFEIGAFDAQTGPAKRLDLTVLENHKQLMQGNEVYLRLYDTLTQSIIQTYLPKQ